MRGIIIEKGENHSILLTPGGEYKRINQKLDSAIGEEVVIRNNHRKHRYIGLIAACLLIVLGLSQIFNAFVAEQKVYAYVTMDINPSVEFAINRDERVISARALNGDAEKVLANMQYKGEKIDKALSDFTKASIALQYISDTKENNILISVVEREKSDEKNLQEQLKHLKIVQQEILTENQQKAEVASVVVDEQVREEAEVLGITAAKLKVIKSVEKAEEITEQVKEEELGDILKRGKVTLEQAVSKIKIEDRKRHKAENETKDKEKDEDGRKKARKKDSDKIEEQKRPLIERKLKDRLVERREQNLDRKAEQTQEKNKGWDRKQQEETNAYKEYQRQWAEQRNKKWEELQKEREETREKIKERIKDDIKDKRRKIDKKIDEKITRHSDKAKEKDDNKDRENEDDKDDEDDIKRAEKAQEDKRKNQDRNKWEKFRRNADRKQDERRKEKDEEEEEDDEEEDRDGNGEDRDRKKENRKRKNED